MKWLTQWAITSSALILIVLAVRVLFRDQLSARLRYALWAVVLVRLLVPFQVELPAAASLPVLASNFAPEVADVELYALRTYSRPLSEDNLAEMRERGVNTGTVIGTEAPIHHIGDVEIEGYAHCFVLSDTGIDTYFFYTTLPKFLMVLWVIGTVWVALTIFHSNRYFYGRLKYYRHALEGTESPVPVYTAANLSSPCLFGVFRPAVYVTPAAANPDALRHVLAHELTHYAHKDHIWSLLRCLALALHWYNPLVWLAVVLSKRDGELACDEGAVARLGEAERIPYGRTLVDMVAARSLRPTDLLSCSTAMTGKSVQQRVARLVKQPETVKTALFAAVAVVALAAVFVFGTRPAGQEPEDLLTQFHARAEQAVSIQYCPPLISSQTYPDPITNPELLRLAKESLSRFVIQDPDTVVTGWSQKLMSASRIILSDGETESTYALCMGEDGRTYLFDGADFEACMSEPAAEVAPIARTEGRSSLESSIATYARMQPELTQDPTIPIPMTQAELSSHTPEGIWEAIGYRLQGWSGDLRDAEFHIGYLSLTRMQLWYYGDKTHEGVWVLEMLAPGISSNSSGYSVVSDQPMEVFNAARYASDDFSYEMLGPGAFLAFLRPEDVIGAYLTQDGAPVYGEQVSIRVEEVKELAVQGLYHQLAFSEYDAEQYGQHGLVLAVEQDLKTYRDYEIADTANQVSLTIGSEPDVVCLSHWSLSVSSSPARQFIYSPELYRVIQTLHGLTPGQTPLLSAYDRYHSQLAAAQGMWRSSTMLHDSRVLTDSAQLEQAKKLLTLAPQSEMGELQTWTGYWNYSVSFTSATPDADWTGDSGFCYYYVNYGGGDQWYVFLPTNETSGVGAGVCLGRLPAGSWDAANQLFETAPSVDDRQHADQR